MTLYLKVTILLFFVLCSSGQLISITSPSKVTVSPSEYLNDMYLSYSIELPPTEALVQLRVSQYQIEEDYDFLIVYVYYEDEPDTYYELDYLTGFGRNKIYTFESDVVKIDVDFVTDYSVTDFGFEFYVGYDLCGNNEIDGAESDVDCAGVCFPCAVGMDCVTGSDCASGVCTDGVCNVIPIRSDELNIVTLNGYDSFGRCNYLVQDLDVQGYGHYVSHLNNGFYPNPPPCAVVFSSGIFSKVQLYFDGSDYVLESDEETALESLGGGTFELTLFNSTANLYISLKNGENAAFVFDRDTDHRFLPRSQTNGFFLSFMTNETEIRDTCTNGFQVSSDNIMYNYIVSDFAGLLGENLNCTWHFDSDTFADMAYNTIQKGSVLNGFKSMAANYVILDQTSGTDGIIYGFNGSYIWTNLNTDYVESFPIDVDPFRRITSPVSQIQKETSWSLSTTSAYDTTNTFFLSVYPSSDINRCNGIVQEYESTQCIVLRTGSGIDTFNSDCPILVTVDVNHLVDSDLFFVFPTTGISPLSDGFISIKVDGKEFTTITPTRFGFPKIPAYPITESKRLTISIILSPGYDSVGLSTKFFIGTASSLSNCYFSDMSVKTISNAIYNFYPPRLVSSHYIFFPSSSSERLSHIVNSVNDVSDYYIIQSDTEVGKYIHPGSTSPVESAKIIFITTVPRHEDDYDNPITAQLISRNIENQLDVVEAINKASNKLIINDDFIMTVTGQEIATYTYTDLVEYDFLDQIPFTTVDDDSYFNTPYGNNIVYHGVSSCDATISTTYSTNTKYGQFDVFFPMTDDWNFYLFGPSNNIFGRIVQFTDDCTHALLTYSSQLLALVDLDSCENGMPCFSQFIVLNDEYLYDFKMLGDVVVAVLCDSYYNNLKIVQWTLDGTNEPERLDIFDYKEIYCIASDHISLDLTEQYVTVGIRETQKAIVFDLSNNATYCISQADDELFGTSVYITLQSNELVVMGSKLYVYSLNEMGEYEPSLEICHSPTTMIPNRFTYPGEDWNPIHFSDFTIEAGATKTYFAETDTSVLVMKHSTPESDDEKNNNFRSLPFSEEGHYFKYSTVVVDGWASQLWNNVLCERGTFKEHAGISLCQMCPAGSSQSQQGQTSCTACDEGFYCPLGSVVPLNITDSVPVVIANRFAVTEGDSSMDELMFASLFGDASTGLGAYFLYCFILLLLILIILMILVYVPMAPIASFQHILKKFIKQLDVDKEASWNPKTQKVEIEGSVKGGLSMIGTIFLFVTTIIWGLYFFNGYVYFDDMSVQLNETKYPDLNNDRKSYYQPEFTASDDVREKLSLIEKETLVFRINLVGFRNDACESICDYEDLFEIGAINIGDGSVTCTEVNHACNIEWMIDDLELAATNDFQVNLHNIYVQEVQLGISTYYRDLSEDTLMLASSIDLRIQLPSEVKDEQNLLFDIKKEFELIRIVQNSDVQNPGKENIKDGTLWSLQRLFDPTNPADEEFRYTSADEYLSSEDQNTITVTVRKPKSFVYNREKKVLGDSELLFGFILLIMAITGVWDFVFALFNAIYSFAKFTCCNDVARDEELELDNFDSLQEQLDELKEIIKTHKSEIRKLKKKN